MKILPKHLDKYYKTFLAQYANFKVLLYRQPIIQSLIQHPKVCKVIKKWQGIQLEYKLVILGVCFFILWMTSGLFAKNHEEIDRKNGNINNFYKIENFKAKKLPVSVGVWGTATASNHITISSQVFGRVLQIVTKPGSCLAKGDPILVIEKSNKSEELLRAQSDAKQTQRKYDTIKKLYDKGLSSKLELEAAITAMRGAQSALSLAEEQLDKTTVTAPFAGCIDDIKVKEGEILSAGHNEIGDFADLHNITVQASLSLREAQKIANAEVAQIITKDKKELHGKVKFLGRIGDAKDHTLVAKLEFDNQDLALISGTIVYAKIIGKQQMVQQIPHSALIVNDDGEVGVLIMAKDVAKYIAIEVLGENDDSIIAAGLPDDVDIVTMGQAYFKN